MVVRVRGRVPFHELPAVRAALREITAPGATLADAIGRLTALAAPARGATGDLDDLDDIDDLDDEPSGGRQGTDGDRDALARLLGYAEQYRQIPGSDAAGFRAWLVQEADDTIGGDGVELVTFHGAKGREWRVVHVIGAEQASQPHSITLADRHVSQSAAALGDGAQGTESEIDSPIGVPCAEQRRPFRRCRVPVVCARGSVSERQAGGVKCPKCVTSVGQLDVDQVTDRAIGVDGDLLLGDPQTPDAADRSRVGGERPGQDVQQG